VVVIGACVYKNKPNLLSENTFINSDKIKPKLLFIQASYADKEHSNSRIDPIDVKVFRQTSSQGRPELIINLKSYIQGPPTGDIYAVDDPGSYILSPNGRYLAILLSNLIIVDLQNKRVKIINSSQFKFSYNMIFSPDSKKIMAMSYSGEIYDICSISSINLDTLAITNIPKVKFIDDCRDYYFIGWPSDRVAYFEVTYPAHDYMGSTGAILNLLTGEINVTPGNPTFFDHSDNGQLLIVPNESEQLEIYNIESGELLTTIKNQKDDREIAAFSPTNLEILYLDFDKRFNLINLENDSTTTIDDPKSLLYSWKEFDRTYTIDSLMPNVQKKDIIINYSIARYY